jgi:hypothetical protein
VKVVCGAVSQTNVVRYDPSISYSDQMKNVAHVGSDLFPGTGMHFEILNREIHYLLDHSPLSVFLDSTDEKWPDEFVNEEIVLQNAAPRLVAAPQGRNPWKPKPLVSLKLYEDTA